MASNLKTTPHYFCSSFACTPPMDLNPSALDAPGHFLQESFGFETFYKKAKKLCPLNYFLIWSIEQLSKIYENENFWDRKKSKIFDLKIFHFHTIFNENFWNFRFFSISKIFECRFQVAPTFFVCKKTMFFYRSM